jgi:hypothetical protein
MSTIKATTKVVAKFDDGRTLATPKSQHAGRNAKKHIVLGAGKVAFGVGAAVGAVHGFAKGLFS